MPEDVGVGLVVVEGQVAKREQLRLRVAVVDDVSQKLVAGHDEAVGQHGVLRMCLHGAHRLPGRLPRDALVALHHRGKVARPILVAAGPAAVFDLLRPAVYEDVVFDPVVAAVVEMEPRPRASGHDVADHVDAAGVVVEVDAPGEVRAHPLLPLAAVAEDVVEKVVADDRTSGRNPVAAAGIDGARVLRLEVHVADVIQLDLEVVATKHDAHAGAVVDQVAGHAVADAGEGNAHSLLVEHTHVMDVVVFRAVAGWGERRAVAARDRDTVRPGLRDVAAHDGVVGAALDRHAAAGVVADVPDRAAGHAAVPGVPDGDGRTLAALERKPADRHMLGVGAEAQDRGERRHGDGPVGQRLRRQEKERVCLTVVVPLAGRVEFLSHPLDEVTVAWADRIGAVGGQRDVPRCRIDLIDANDIVPPVVARENQDLAVGRLGPRPHVRWLLHERSLALPFDVGIHRHDLAVDVGPAATVGIARVEVRPAGEVLPPAGEDELRELCLVESLRGEIGLQETAAGARVVSHRLPASDDGAADQHRFFIFVGPPDDRCLRRARVLLGKRERLH